MRFSFSSCMAMAGGLSLALLAGCSSSSSDSTPAGPGYQCHAATASITHYKDLAFKQYSDAYDGAVALHDAIDAFLANPSEGTLTSAREAWLSARETYGPTEAWRGWGGPIEGAAADGAGVMYAAGTELEGLINAWPLDEAFLDYVDGNATAGIVHDTEALSKQALIDANGLDDNGDDAEDVVTVGWHAIEFLLWGQDLNASGPGARPASDFVVVSDAPAIGQFKGRSKDSSDANSPLLAQLANPAKGLHDGGNLINIAEVEIEDDVTRRRDVLAYMADLLVDHIAQVRDDWDKDKAGSFASQLADGSIDAHDALGFITNGFFFIAGDELAIERISVAMTIANDLNEMTQTHPTDGKTTGESRSQELEHSCFSDNTHRDIYLNALGVQYLWLGIWDDLEGDNNDVATSGGNGIKDLLAAVNPTLEADVTTKIQAALDACEAISDLAEDDNIPFDQQVLIGTNGRRTTVQAAITALSEAAEAIESAAQSLGLSLSAL